MDYFPSGAVTRQRLPADDRTVRLQARLAQKAGVVGGMSGGARTSIGAPQAGSCSGSNAGSNSSIESPLGGLDCIAAESNAAGEVSVGAGFAPGGSCSVGTGGSLGVGGVDEVPLRCAKRRRRGIRLTWPKKSKVKCSGDASGVDSVGKWLAYRLTAMRIRFSDVAAEQAAYPLGVSEWEVAWQHPVTKAEAGCSWMSLKDIAERHMDWLVADWVQQGSSIRIAYCHGSSEACSASQEPDSQRLTEWEAWQTEHRKREGIRILAANVPAKLLPL